jgi:hypothetical protein
MWHVWEGGVSWGSRLLTPVLPLLGVFLAPMVEKAFSNEPEKTRVYLPLLAGLGFGIQFLTVIANPLYVLIYYADRGLISYSESINSFQNSWLSLQIRYIEHWNACNIDSYSLRQLFNQCK